MDSDPNEKLFPVRMPARGVLAGLALALAACGGGGGGSGSPAATFTFANAAGAATEGGAALAVQVVLHTTQPSLGADVSIDVVDLGTGTATPGTDYSAFAPVTLTFPAGSVDGATQTMPLAALADATVEGAVDTVKLGLANAVGGSVRGLAAFTASLQDADVATIQFASAASATADESSGPRSVTVVLDLAPGVTLGVTASALVSDAGTGSATSGVDYAAFAGQTVTFPAGSPDGATQSVVVQVNDDPNPELDETVNLTLSAPSSGTVVGATNATTLTITDDDSGGPASFVASEGATGVENPLTYDEAVNLGSRAVGAGPNAGTRVRVSNVGGAPMALGAPSLSGANPSDFDVDVEVAPLPPPGRPSSLAFAPATDLASPFRRRAVPAGSAEVGLPLSTDAAGLAVLRGQLRARLHGFPVPGLGDATLDLVRLPLPIAEDAVLRVDDVDVPGGLAGAVGDLSVWRGEIVEVPGSKVFLTVSRGGTRGFLEMPFAGNTLVHLVPEKAGPDGTAACRLVRDLDLELTARTEFVDVCREPRLPPGGVIAPGPAGIDLFAPEQLTTANCRVAIETDHQLFQKFGAVPAATTYVTQMMAAISNQYFTDTQTTLSIAYLGIYSNAADPWTSQDGGGDTAALLDEFRNAWAPSSWPVAANLAHFVSGASLGGGIAYLNVLCNQSFGFGVSGNIAGNINWGAWTGQPGNLTWDFVVVAHEIGHNFGAGHTHSYCPPIDRCYSGPCTGSTQCSRGTLMSYCHLCGGMANLDLEFGPIISNIMRNAVNASCLGRSSLAGGDYVQYRVRFSPVGATGARSANLQFSHDAPNATQPFRIVLQGTATP